ncbi:MAG TPA: hypothetical protein VFT41_13870, partial [Gemmatimonadaceae bacterium]|nr:hypothetical protein [Gemmatimonadaceae bacterium]
MRARFRLAALTLLALSGVTCTDAPTALRHAGGPAMLSLAPAFSVQGMDTYRDLSSFGLTVDNIHIHIDHPPATPFDTTITVPAGADSVVLDLPIELSQTTETLNVQIELRHGSTVLYSGTQTVTATVGAAPSTSTTAVHVTYVGPGASVTQFAIAPRDTAILISGQVPFRATATDDHGAAVPGVEIHWEVKNSSLGAVDQNTGIFSPSGATGSTYVVASLLNGLEDSAAVTVSAPPARLTLVSGGSQTGAAGSTLPAPLVVAVQDASGGPVAGVTVSFASPNGALLDSAATA